MKKLIYSIFAIGTLASQVSCSTDYLDVNNNPNDAYVEQLTPKERLAAAETTLHATHSVTLNRFGNLMMNAWAGNIFQFTAPFNDEVNMNVSSTFYNGIWDNYYKGIANLQTIIETPGATTTYPKYVGAAKVLKAYYMQTIVDLYNDVPYSDAFKGQANVSPKYDKGADVYKALIQELDDAMLLLNGSGTIDAGSDPMFGGDVTRWKQMANTVKLKLVVRLSKATDPAVIAFRDAALATLPTTAASYLATDAIIQPGYNAGNTSQQNPLYRNYGFIDLNSKDINDNYRLVLATEHIIDDLNGVSVRTGGVYDKRIEKMFFNNVWNYFEDATMSPGYEDDFFGLPQGTISQNGHSVGDFAGLGTKQFLITDTATGSSQAGVVMSAAETQFLLAEAAVAFPAKFSNAQTYFNNGVIASFAFYGYSSAIANAYLTQVNALPNVGWTGSADKVAAIQYQRWIALTNINPTETFIGYTKTGYPATPLPIGSATSRPARLIYPQSEYIANSSHVPNMIKSDAFSKTNQFAPFWLK
jgi:hypothetical protein